MILINCDLNKLSVQDLRYGSDIDDRYNYYYFGIFVLLHCLRLTE